jgi:hypothetical protein
VLQGLLYWLLKDPPFMHVNSRTKSHRSYHISRRIVPSMQVDSRSKNSACVAAETRPSKLHVAIIAQLQFSENLIRIVHNTSSGSLKLLPLDDWFLASVEREERSAKLI